jgi:hypothetical protein
MRIIQGKWQSAFESDFGMYDVLVHLTRAMAKLISVEGLVAELSDAFSNIKNCEESERTVLFHIVGAHQQRFVHNDRLIDLVDQKVQRYSMTKPVTDSQVQSSSVCPEKSDARPVLHNHAITSLVQCLLEDNPLPKETQLSVALFKCSIIKLLCLQPREIDSAIREKLLCWLVSAESNSAIKQPLRHLEYALNLNVTSKISSHVCSPEPAIE